MSTIVAATDFSPASETACRYAAALAQDTGSSLLMFHCYVHPASISEIPLSIDLDTASRKAESELTGLAKKIKQEFPMLHVEQRFSVGFLTADLKKLISEINPGLIVMGRHGMSGLEKFLFGSQSIHAMKEISNPILIIPPDCTYKKPDSIAVASDFKEIRKGFPAEKLKGFLRLAGIPRVHIINFSNANKHDPDIVSGSQAIEQMMAPFAVDINILTSDESQTLAANMINFIQENKISILMVIPKHLNFFDRLFRKSDSTQIAWHTAAPLIAMHN